MNYLKNKESKWLSKLFAQYKWDITKMAVKDCAYSSTIKFAQELSIMSRSLRNVFKKMSNT